MTSSRTGLGGLAAVCAGSIVILAILLSALSDVNSWYLFAVAAPLMLPAFIAIHARQRERAGRLGTVALILGCTGGVLLSVSLVVIVVGDGMLGVDWEESAGFGVAALIVCVIIGSITLLIGLIAFGIATVRANVLPRFAGVLLAVGIPLAVLIDISTGAFFNDTPAPVGLYVGVPLFGLGLAWIGFALWYLENVFPSRPPATG